MDTGRGCLIEWYVRENIFCVSGSCSTWNFFLQVLVDWSRIKIFGGHVETPITTQTFPSEDAVYSGLFSAGVETPDVRL